MRWCEVIFYTITLFFCCYFLLFMLLLSDAKRRRYDQTRSRAYQRTSYSRPSATHQSRYHAGFTNRDFFDSPLQRYFFGTGCTINSETLLIVQIIKKSGLLFFFFLNPAAVTDALFIFTLYPLTDD